MSKKKVKKEDVYVILISLLLLAVNALRIWNDSISGDEGFSIMLIKMNIPSMIAETAADVHPPLYYLLYKFFALFGGFGAAAGRIFSFLPIAVSAVLANTYIKKRFGALAAVIFLALLTFTHNCIEMIVEIRMYTWAMLFVTLTALSAYELIREKKIYKWIGLSVFGLAGAYMHYYALIMTAFIYVFLFVVMVIKDRKNILPCFICAVVAIAAYFPWLLVLLRQFGTVTEEYWISGVDIRECIRYVFGAGRIGQLLRITMVISVLIYLFTKEGFTITTNIKEKEKVFMRFDWSKTRTLDADRLLVLLCGITTVGTLAVGITVSYIFRPLYIERYLYSAMGLVSLAFGIAFTRCSRKKIYSWILIAFILITGARQFSMIYNQEKGYQTEQSKAFFAENLQKNDVIVTNDAMISWTLLSYYFEDNKTSHIAYYDLMKEDYETAWFLNTGTEPDYRIKEYEEKGLSVTYVGEYGIGRYPYALYKIEK